MRADSLRLPGLLALALVHIFVSSARAEPVAAYRLVLEYNRGAVKLRDVVPVTKTLAPTETGLGGGASAIAPARQGAWYEVRSQQGTVLYRRLMHDPAAVSFEGPASPAGGEITRVETVVDQGVFTVLVPQDPNAAEVVLFAPPHDAPAARPRAVPSAEPPRPAQEIGRIPFPPPTLP